MTHQVLVFQATLNKLIFAELPVLVCVQHVEESLGLIQADLSLLFHVLHGVEGVDGLHHLFQVN